MELALLVYIISLLEPVAQFLTLLAFLLGTLAGITWFWYGMSSLEEFGMRFKWPGITTAIFCLVMLVNVLIPSEKTAYLMVGAYATQKIAEAPKTQQIGADVVKIIESKIKFYADQSAKELEEKLTKDAAKK